MDRLEYEIYQWLGGVSPDQIRGELSRRGSEGWELVGIHPSAPGGAMLLEAGEAKPVARQSSVSGERLATAPDVGTGLRSLAPDWLW